MTVSLCARVVAVCAVAGLTCLAVARAPAAPLPVVTLATWDHVPYVGEGLPGGGYATQLVKTALERAGYRVRLSVVPAARARYMAEVGSVDGVMPIASDPQNREAFELSAAFPGDRLGLLKRRSMKFALPRDAVHDAGRFWQALKPFRLGLLRGDYQLARAARVPDMRLELATSDLQNIDKLAHKRVDLLVIDRFTAADVILKHRPHLVGELSFVPGRPLERDFHVGFSRARPGHAVLRAAFDRALAQLRSEGGLDQIRALHGLRPARVRTENDGRLVIATVDNPDMKIMQKLSRHYEERHSGVKLEWSVLDENTLRTRLLSDVALDDGQYDVMTIGSFEATTWAQMEWLTPLASIPPSYDLADLLTPVREQLTTRGAMYALPFYAESSATFYRTDLLARAGLSMPEHPTYAQLELFARRLHDPANGVYGVCLRGQPGWGANMAFITTLVHTSGGRWFDLQWSPTLDTPAWRSALELYQRLGRFAPPSAPHNNYNENLALFAAGQCALWVDATVAAGVLFDPRRSRVHDRTGYARAPTAATPRGSSWLWVWALAVPSSSRSQGEARNFVTWATSREYAALVGASEGWLAAPPGVRRSTYEEPAYRAAAPFGPFVRAAVESARPAENTLEPSPYQGHYVARLEYPAVGDLVGAEAQKVLLGRQSPVQALTRSQRIVAERVSEVGDGNQ
jgi:sorbitol/mannitol transport system substrate-binding protein